jgi:hypothetical protein
MHCEVNELPTRTPSCAAVITLRRIRRNGSWPSAVRSSSAFQPANMRKQFVAGRQRPGASWSVGDIAEASSHRYLSLRTQRRVCPTEPRFEPVISNQQVRQPISTSPLRGEMRVTHDCELPHPRRNACLSPAPSAHPGHYSRRAHRPALATELDTTRAAGYSRRPVPRHACAVRHRSFRPQDRRAVPVTR